MGTREELLMENEYKMEEQKELITSLFHSLGMTIYENRTTNPIPLGGRLLTALEEAGLEANKAQAELEINSSIFAEYNMNYERAEILERELEALREEDRVERERLGALVYEQCSLSLLDYNIFVEIYKDVESEKSLIDKRMGSFIDRVASKAGLVKLKKNSDARFQKYAGFVIDGDYGSKLSGENAPRIIARIVHSSSLIKEKDSELNLLNDYLQEHGEKHRSLERSGLDHSQKRVEEAMKLYYDSVADYGSFLYGKASDWINENTSSDILDILQNILEAQDLYNHLGQEKQRLQREDRIDDYRALIEQEEEKIRILEKEKEKIDKQIDRIKEEILRLETLIDRV